MTIEERVLEKLRDLPVDKQKEVLDFVDFLSEKNGTKKPRPSLRGLWKDLNIQITEEDIAQARREMWHSHSLLRSYDLRLILMAPRPRT
jgi:hypothetical protein